ncbi:MAG: polysaccharide deacetylase family protein [Bacillota bacterium]
MIRKALLPALLATSLGLAACSASALQGQVEPPTPAQVSPAPTPPAQLDPPKTEPPKPQLPPWVTPVTDENFAALVQTHRPNEMGRVLILEYHHFGEEEERWTRTWENFRKDLETLYAKGFRAVNLMDYLNDDMKLPAGTSPVIFTFDDSMINQFRVIRKADGTWEPDPKSVPAVMLQFAREYPDFGVAGTFYVKFTEVPFEEEDLWKEKLQFLVEHGFEVGNHSYTHDNLALLDDDGVRRSLGMQVKRIKEALPDYDGGTIALPLGQWPKNRALLVEGEYQGTRYKHRAVLEVADSPVPSPYDRRQDVYALQRTQAIQSEFDRWFPFLEKYRYISDGDPDTIVIPASLEERLNPEKIQGKKVRTYPDPAK